MAFSTASDSYFCPSRHYNVRRLVDCIPDEWALDELRDDQLHITPELRLPQYDDTQDMLVKGLDTGRWNELGVDLLYDGVHVSHATAAAADSSSVDNGDVRTDDSEDPGDSGEVPLGDEHYDGASDEPDGDGGRSGDLFGPG